MSGTGGDRAWKNDGHLAAGMLRQALIAAGPSRQVPQCRGASRQVPEAAQPSRRVVVGRGKSREVSMHKIRHLLAAFALLAACVATVPARASLGTNFTDMWWIPTESGWGASIHQQYDVMYILLFVQGPDTRPIWYAGPAYYQNNTGLPVFTGDLYQTNGPWFGGDVQSFGGDRPQGRDRDLHRDQRRHRDAHLLGRRRRRDQGNRARALGERGFHRRILRRTRLQRVRLLRSDDQRLFRAVRPAARRP